MPPRKTPASSTTAGSTAATSAGKTPARRAAGAARPSRARPAAAEEPAMTLAEALEIRPTHSHGPADEESVTRSFHLRVGDVERAKATADGIQHRAYGTPLEDVIPRSLSAFIAEAIQARCTYYENLLNDHAEFRRVRQLSPGPSPEGARRGAAKRAATRAAAAAASEPES